MQKTAQEYRSPRNKNVKEDGSYQVPKERSYSEYAYRAPKNIKEDNKSNLTKTKKFISSEVRNMQSSIQNLLDSFSDKSELLNSFLSSYSTTKTNLQNVFNSLKDNFEVDNSWGKQTQQSLVNVLELAAALLNLNDTLKLNINSFTIKDFNELKNDLLGFSIQANNKISLTIQEQIERAKSIKNKINSLIIFYNEIVDAVSSSKTLSFTNKLIDSGKKSLDKAELSNIDDVLLETVNNFYMKIKTFQGEVNVPLISLKNRESYLSWAKDKLKMINPKDAELFFSRYIKPQANTAIINSDV